ncbi:hypothetical protein [Maribacter polysaccharolyticus]|uniref:hypothetical protein n=1 Tax=Maribacter polysaccharolyticus TaxID=3020831 RepID=UPI00237F30F7|nr:hypothetical protein [Maribacter polysaccharolyticus]MDE3742383.1 hypothetical protein [Maribacter polysaccharolyticus]
MGKQSTLFWNLIIVVTISVCLLAFLAHSKNWTQTDDDQFKILSGFYYKKLKYADLDSVLWVERIPPMERLNGFSGFDKEKGIFREFKDSLTTKKVSVFIDNFSNGKIKIVYKDSLSLYVNYKDSLETVGLFNLLKGKITPAD